MYTERLKAQLAFPHTFAYHQLETASYAVVVFSQTPPLTSFCSSFILGIASEADAAASAHRPPGLISSLLSQCYDL